jgi:hypothetical protein
MGFIEGQVWVPLRKMRAVWGLSSFTIYSLAPSFTCFSTWCFVRSKVFLLHLARSKGNWQSWDGGCSIRGIYQLGFEFLGATLFFWIEGNNERWWGEKEIVASLFIFFISTWRWGERCGRGGGEGGSAEKWEDGIKKIVRDEREEREGMERLDRERKERKEMERKGERRSAGGERGRRDGKKCEF